MARASVVVLDVKVAIIGKRRTTRGGGWELYRRNRNKEFARSMSTTLMVKPERVEAKGRAVGKERGIRHPFVNLI
jgi:hypothetical protein